MTFNTVIVRDLDDVVNHLPDLSSKIGFKLADARLTLVKPNICGLYHPSSDLLSSIIKLLLPHTESIVIGDTKSMMHIPEEQFKRLGLYTILQRFSGNVRAVDLSDDEWVKVHVSKPHALREIDLPRTALDSDVLLNVPKVGTHSTTHLTCALKNLFGLLPQRDKYGVFHPLGMDKVIADIAQVVQPDLNIVDAGSKAVLGMDTLAVDVVACRFVNLNPLKVEHLRLVSEDRGVRLEDFVKMIEVVEL